MMTWKDFCDSIFGIRLFRAEKKIVTVNGKLDEMPLLTDKVRGFYYSTRNGHILKMKINLER